MKNPDDIKAIQLAEYRQPPYWARKVFLTLELDPDNTRVISRVEYEHNPGHSKTLELNGKELDLKSLKIDGKAQAIAELKYSPEQLTLENLPEKFTLEIETIVHPIANKALEGLYISKGAFFSQCEAQGFRRFTYFLDRPDVMAIYETTIIADKKNYPVLLSNGNKVEAKDLADGKQLVRWHDPHPKPSYLFALVAGKLGHIEDHFTTKSGRRVALQIYVEEENLHKCQFAFSAIKHAMKWDEDVYGLEYDLDIFMIVAVSDFNMGAMENKGLNIFNAKYVLASPETATDKDFENILAIVGHEYFHNWSGNRVTLRDWFQLSLKEGLTVFRDQQFSSDHGSAAVNRIIHVKHLREHQFPEDDSPISHPVRPESYIEINNFYTMTVYEKGAEIVRMLHTLLGDEAYYKAMKEYFKRFDGQAVTIEDMLNLIEETSGRKLDQFKRWYQQAGTPVLHVERAATSSGIQLKFRQELPKRPGEPDPKNLLIPFRVAFLGRDKKPLESLLNGKKSHEHLLELKEEVQDFTFEGIPADSIPSLLRGFSAPVKLRSKVDTDELLVALSSETDAFNKYEAAQQLAEDMLGKPLTKAYLDAFRSLLTHAKDDPYLTALTIQAPLPDQLASSRDTIDLDKVFADYQNYCREIGKQTYADLKSTYDSAVITNPKDQNGEAVAKRELRNTILAYLCDSEKPEAIELLKIHYYSAKTMTDKIAALEIIVSIDHPLRDELVKDFYDTWKKDPLVIDKWFSAQASSLHPKVLDHVKELVKHPDFDLYNPNRVYSVFRKFTRAAPYGFHKADGGGYEFLADYVIKLDKANPQVASRIAGALTKFKFLDVKRQALVKKALKRISETEKLSSDVFEIVSKSLK